jgi:hypothetical protein
LEWNPLVAKTPLEDGLTPIENDGRMNTERGHNHPQPSIVTVTFDGHSPGFHPYSLSRLMKKSLGRCRSAGFQPAIPLGSSKAGKMPALQMASRRLFHQPVR